VYSDGELPPGTRNELRNRLIARRPEFQQIVLTRVYAIDDPAGVSDPEYADGLRTAVTESVDFAIAAIGGEEPPPIPLSLYSQARLAARNGVSPNTVLRRYLAGFFALIELVEREAEYMAMLTEHSTGLRGRLTQLLEALIEEISQEHSREVEIRAQSRESRRVMLVEQLLAGIPVDAAEFAFDFDSWHVGLIAKGPGAADVVEELARAADRRLLRVRRGEDAVWAWLGGRRRLETTEIQLLAAKSMPAEGCLAMGEPCRRLPGWRLSHRQAAAALPVGLRRGDRVVRYAEVLLQASMIQDHTLASSLRQIFLVPLEEERDGGRIARETLRAYFSRERNISSAAAVLGVSRQTVAQRLHAIEDRLGCPLHTCAAEIEAALDLEWLDALPSRHARQRPTH
jgi:PucR C-terminal helix-turn-helix domain/GGDEF-like domain